MRETYSSLLQTAQDLCVDSSTTLPQITTLSDTKTFLQKEINKAVRFTFSYLKDHPRTQILPKTASTVATQQYYHYPAAMDGIETCTVNVGGIIYPVQIIDSEVRWNYLNQITFTGFTIPQYIFPRKDDFGLFPIPQGVFTMTFNGHYNPIDMTAADYKIGTVTIGNGTTRVTGSGTTFTASMVGQWFTSVTEGNWYRIASYTSATAIDIESYFEGTGVSGDMYTIGQSPEIPPELHEYLPYKAAAAFYAGPRRDIEQAQAMLNYFYTGDLTNGRRNPQEAVGGVAWFRNQFRSYGMGNSGLTNRNQQQIQVFDERWRATITL